MRLDHLLSKEHKSLEDKKGETALFNFEVPSKELKKRIRKKSYGLIAQVVRAHA